MSFILDALKKSESDRQRQSGPSLFEVKVAPPRRRLPIWAVAIAVLLGINIIVVSWMLLRHPAGQQAPPVNNSSAAAPAPGVSGAASSAPAPAVPRERADSERADSGGARADTTSGLSATRPGEDGSGAGKRPAPQGTASGTAPIGSPMTRAAAPAASAVAPPASSSQPPGDQSDYAPAVQPAAGSVTAGGSAGDLPLYRQIASSAGIPELHLDLHVFADRPQDRFVMINMHRVAEGDSLPNGVQVEAIRPDGVVLSFRGTRFLLPRN